MRLTMGISESDDGACPRNALRFFRATLAALIFSVVGTGSLSIVNYLNEKKVPFLFPATAHKKYPWVMGWVPTFASRAAFRA